MKGIEQAIRSLPWRQVAGALHEPTLRHRQLSWAVHAHKARVSLPILIELRDA